MELVQYFGPVFSQLESEKHFTILKKEIKWKQDELVIFGRKIITQRMVAWYGDQNYDYVYSKSRKQALPWTKELLFLKKIVENKSGLGFNSCLLNYYHSGEEGMGWHSDDEDSLEDPIHIASLSFGANRRFDLRHKKTKEKKSFWLEKGSLLLMKHPCQELYQHALPKTKKIKEARINLTFRKMKT
jgi:alkylated DNA repair dioxygenase AlkB